MEKMQGTRNNIVILKEVQDRWAKVLKDDSMIYLYAMTGFGKTTQVVAFAKSRYNNWELISANDEEFFDKLRETEQSLLKTRVNTLIILDDLQWIFQERERTELFEILARLKKNRKAHIFLVSRANVPSYLAPFRVTRQMSIDNRDSLKFSMEEIRLLLETYPNLSELDKARKDKSIEFCFKVSKGYALGVNAFFQRLNGQVNDYKTSARLAVQDVYDFLSINLFGQWTSSRKTAAISLSVYEFFNIEMAERILGDQANDIIRDFVEVGSFIKYTETGEYYFEVFFREYLLQELMKMTEDEWIPLFEIAGACYERNRNYAQSLYCWDKAKRQDKVAEIVIYLSENAEGCSFAKTAAKYIKDLPAEWEQRDPRLIGAKVMLAAYQMRPDECIFHLNRLKALAEEEKGRIVGSGALAAYVRTSIACPYDTADKLKDNMLLLVNYVKDNGLQLNNIMPTGNLPSLVNGGLDLLPWFKNKKMLYPIIKVASEKLMGMEAIGIADASMGEAYYEQNESTKAMAALTKALSAANFNGSIRVQYAATGIMSRLFQSEGQIDTADEILNNILEKAISSNFNELIPNIKSTLMCSALLKDDKLAVDEWLKNDAPNEYDEFYITIRYQLLTKARVYVSQGKNLEAWYILNVIESFAELYSRTYLQIEVLTLKAIILYRRGESWEETLVDAVENAKTYGLVRIFADQGAALLPLWKEMDWDESGVKWNKLNVIEKAMKRMAGFYPNYLKVPRKKGALSKKECEVLELIAEGYNNSKIAEVQGVNIGTIKFHVTNILKKLEVSNRTLAVKIAKEEGIL